MRRSLANVVLLALAASALLLIAPAGASARRVPFGFFGVFNDITSIRLSPGAQVKERNLMVQSGVESMRLLVSWPDAQPYPNFASVPRRQRTQFLLNVDGVPTDLTRIDQAVGIAAARGIRVLPVISFSPGWASKNAFQPGADPRDLPAYGRFLAAIVHRYGRHGTFWRSHRAPFSARIRQYQVWNEMDLPFMWTNGARTFAPEYVALLREARQAVKAEDPSAQIVLGGLTSSTAWPRVWDALDAVYRAGGKGLFDVAAVHPYTRTPEGVLKILELTREVMTRNGDGGTPLLVTEFSWSSRKGHSHRRLATWEVSQAQQARNLTRAYSLFAANQRRLHLIGAYWYAWLTNDHTQFWSYWSGLRRLAGDHREAKPAQTAFQRSARIYEGCRKTSFATRCG